MSYPSSLLSVLLPFALILQRTSTKADTLSSCIPVIPFNYSLHAFPAHPAVPKLVGHLNHLLASLNNLNRNTTRNQVDRSNSTQPTPLPCLCYLWQRPRLERYVAACHVAARLIHPATHKSTTLGLSTTPSTRRPQNRFRVLHRSAVSSHQPRS